MRHTVIICLASTLALSACATRDGDAEVQRAMQDLSAVENTNLNDVMLTVGDPDEAVKYFQSALANDPGRVDLQRGLAKSLVRAGRANEAVTAWKLVIANPGSNLDDRVDMAEAQIRNNAWDDAAATLNGIPPTHETFNRYKLEAMIADSKQQWSKADSFYQTAVGLTTTLSVEKR